MPTARAEPSRREPGLNRDEPAFRGSGLGFGFASSASKGVVNLSASPSSASASEERLWMEDRTAGVDRRRDELVLVSFDFDWDILQSI